MRGELEVQSISGLTRLEANSIFRKPLTLEPDPEFIPSGPVKMPK